MQINPIKTINFKNNYIPVEKKSEKKSSFSNNSTLSKIPFESFRANFLPFEGFRKVGEAFLVDKETGEDVVATIKRENRFGQADYKLYVGRKEAGYMDLNFDSTFPKCYDDIHDCTNPVPMESFLEIHHLRSLLGDKYAKIGSTLINIAIEESKKHNMDGAVWLGAEKGYKEYDSPYRSGENPIPFYYKMGFKAADSQDNTIQKLLKNKEYDKLPVYALLVLTPEDANSNNKYHEKNFIMK